MSNPAEAPYWQAPQEEDRVELAPVIPLRPVDTPEEEPADRRRPQAELSDEEVTMVLRASTMRARQMVRDDVPRFKPLTEEAPRPQFKPVSDVPSDPSLMVRPMYNPSFGNKTRAQTELSEKDKNELLGRLSKDL